MELYASDIQYLQDELDKLFNELPGGASVMSIRDTPTVNSFTEPGEIPDKEPEQYEGNEMIVTE